MLQRNKKEREDRNIKTSSTTQKRLRRKKHKKINTTQHNRAELQMRSKERWCSKLTRRNQLEIRKTTRFSPDIKRVKRITFQVIEITFIFKCHENLYWTQKINLPAKLSC